MDDIRDKRAERDQETSAGPTTGIVGYAILLVFGVLSLAWMGFLAWLVFEGVRIIATWLFPGAS